MKHCGTVKLQTERLVLRRISQTDSKEIFLGFRNQPEFLYYANKQKVTLQQQEKSLEQIDNKYLQADYYNWLITLKDDGKIIGAINLNVNEKQESVMFNYAIDNRNTNRGYMTEALLAVKTFCFDVLRVKRFEGGCVVGNLASQRVMEKCGLRFEKVVQNHVKLSDGLHDMLLFAQTNKD